MNEYHERRYRCPHCFSEFKTGEWSDEVEFTCRSCGNDFMLGEAKRGRPDPIPDPLLTVITDDIIALTARVQALEEWVAALEQRHDRA